MTNLCILGCIAVVVDFRRKQSLAFQVNLQTIHMKFQALFSTKKKKIEFCMLHLCLVLEELSIANGQLRI